MLASVKVAAVEEPDIPKTTNSKHEFLCGVLVCFFHGAGLGVGGRREGMLLVFTWWLLNESGTCGNRTVWL